jgi:hypothetical protein
MNSHNLTPEQMSRAHEVWSELAADAVIRHMNGGHLTLVSFSAAVERVRREGLPPRRHRTAEFNATKPRRVTRAAPLTTIEKQTLAGLELELPQGAIAKNLGVSEMQIEDAVKLLRKRGLL